MLRLKREIAKARKSVQKKYLDLRRGAADYQIEAEKKFKPLITPLAQIVKKESVAPKVEPKFEQTFAGEPQFEEPEYEDDWGQYKDTPSYHETPALYRARAPAAINLAMSPDSPGPSTARGVEQTRRVGSEYEYNPEIEHPDAEETFQRLFWDMGPMAQQYMRAIIAKPNVQDTVYGIKHEPDGRVDSRGKFVLGNKEVDFDHNDLIHVGRRTFRGTEGLYSLLFLKKPAKGVVTDADLAEYKIICDLTSLHKVGHRADARIKTGSWEKYTTYIKKIFPPKHSQRRGGKGLLVRNNSKKYNYIYYDDVSEIIERLRVLHAARDAGNTALTPEINSILSELRQRQIIV